MTNPCLPGKQIDWRRAALFCGLWVQACMPLQAQTAVAADLAPVPAEWRPAELSRSLSFDVRSKFTGQRYRILIGLPHKAAPAGGYPVLWALDGLASFPLMEVVRPRPPAATESAQWRQKIGEEPAGLIVAVGYASGDAIDVNARALDYTPQVTGNTGDAFSTQHGGADAFLRFLTEELRPQLARYFPMHPQKNTLFGFSYGGLFALHTLSTQPQYFQRYWAASPSLWFGESVTMKALPQRLRALQPGQGVNKVVVTVGLDEQYPASFASPEVRQRLQARTMVDNAELFARLLTESASTGVQVQFQKLAAHDHQDMLMHGARRVVDFAFAE
jgi:predicted alpha/beta superfamily hydrolase